MDSRLRTVVLSILVICAGLEVRLRAAPNFLIILTDDQGYGDVSINGAKDVQTPNIDRIGREGMVFTSMRANATVCSPSRAALLTGRYADRVGVPGLIRSTLGTTWGYFRTGVPTLADELARGGYHTAHVGKWNLGLESPNLPNERGFAFFHGFLGDMMDSYTTHLRQGSNYLRLNGETVQAEGHATDVFTDWAIDYLQQRAREKDRPFFLYLAYNAPHFPIEPPADWLEKVKQRLPDVDPARVANIALVEHLDFGIGRVLNALDDLGLTQTTLVAFASDNGGSLPHAASNHPWRDGKQSHYDGGLRVPFLVRWPEKIAPGSRSDYAGLSFDLFPTLLDLAEVTSSNPEELDAVSLLPILSGGKIERNRQLYFVRREGGRRYGGKSYEALIRGDWKLLQNDPYSPLELYNLKNDPEETTNLAQKAPKIFNELSDLLSRHIQRGGSVPWEKSSP